ncbi:kinase domain-containing protein [Aspergillus sclerotiicarbonarius CBS 121057]|uniref:non-specific serine/threonine protein kinase n=1 Tax=Aspergillus sclerotiicarbonarius (strain CBS 121057 / IBT 28362) TaxID=1448318 RepID=A0A319F671_ASPSB|nr:kinase domain-containing protein [Aspergillus sclerotiicarbonarius CBS 121057]
MLSLQTFARTHVRLKRCHTLIYRIASVDKFHIRRASTSSGTRTSDITPEKSPYQLIEDVEDLDRYCPGGYHPLRVGDELSDGRYQLVDKLGYGGYSTIWLARDRRRSGYVAVKAITADASGSTDEASLIRSLREPSDRLGKEIVPPLLDEFWVSGPNGKHRCVVTPPARMSLFDAKESSRFGLFQPKVAQSIIAQLIRGVAFLHSQDTVHGDIHLGNILVQLPKAIDGLSTPELYQRFGEPESEAVVRIDGKALPSGVPAQVFFAAWFGVRSDEIALGEEKIILNDFGESFNPHKSSRYSSKTLPLLQPPETRFPDEPLSFASDIWTLACTIWEIFGQRPLFETFFPTRDRVTMEQVQVLGILPPEWWGKWDRRLEWFAEDGELNMKPGVPRRLDGVRRTWEMRFSHGIQEPRAEAGLQTVTDKEKRAFDSMLRSMLNFRPNERATARQVLQSEWMNSWGLPALEQSWSTSNSTMEQMQMTKD